MTSTNMRRGIGGRIEDAFAAAKDRGEAAFVSFVTAGYPSPEGECSQHSSPSLRSMEDLKNEVRKKFK